MNISAPFFSKIFKAETNQDAYIKACKWVAKNVISNNNDSSVKDLKETFWKVDKERDGEWKLTLYCMIDFKEKENKFCEMCQVYHKRFYYNEERDCSRCNHKAFKTRVEENLSIKKSYRKELINKRLNGG